MTLRPCLPAVLLAVICGSAGACEKCGRPAAPACVRCVTPACPPPAACGSPCERSVTKNFSLISLAPAPAAPVVGSVPMVVAAPMAMATVGYAPAAAPLPAAAPSPSLTDALLARALLGEACRERDVAAKPATADELAERIEKIEGELAELSRATLRLADVVEKLHEKVDAE